MILVSCQLLFWVYSRPRMSIFLQMAAGKVDMSLRLFAAIHLSYLKLMIRIKHFFVSTKAFQALIKMRRVWL